MTLQHGSYEEVYAQLQQEVEELINLLQRETIASTVHLKGRAIRYLRMESREGKKWKDVREFMRLCRIALHTKEWHMLDKFLREH